MAKIVLFFRNKKRFLYKLFYSIQSNYQKKRPEIQGVLNIGFFMYYGLTVNDKKYIEPIKPVP